MWQNIAMPAVHCGRRLLVLVLIPISQGSERSRRWLSLFVINLQPRIDEVVRVLYRRRTSPFAKGMSASVHEILPAMFAVMAVVAACCCLSRTWAPSS